MAAELLEIFCCHAVRLSLRLCCVPEDTIEAVQRQHRNPRLVCYLDGLSDEVVKRQLEFRKERKIQRENSQASLASLAIVSEEDESHFRQTPLPDIRKTMSTPSLSSLHGDTRMRKPRTPPRR